MRPGISSTARSPFPSTSALPLPQPDAIHTLLSSTVLNPKNGKVACVVDVDADESFGEVRAEAKEKERRLRKLLRDYRLSALSFPKPKVGEAGGIWEGGSISRGTRSQTGFGWMSVRTVD